MSRLRESHMRGGLSLFSTGFSGLLFGSSAKDYLIIYSVTVNAYFPLPTKMLSLRTLPYLHRPISPSFPLRSPPLRAFLPFSAAAAKMSTAVEHVVLFKVRPSADPSAMVSNLLSLTSLNLASHLSVTPILRHRSSAASAAGFTHLLHSRYPSKPDLAAYSAHPDHVAVVKNNVLPICDDIMALDWISTAAGPPPGSAARLTLAKPKEGVESSEIVDVLAGVEGSAPAGVVQVSYGENFSPGRAKGYGVGFLTVFPGLEELDGLDAAGEVEAFKEKVRPLLESVIVVDYLIPAPVSASL